MQNQCKGDLGIAKTCPYLDECKCHKHGTMKEKMPNFYIFEIEKDSGECRRDKK